MSGAGLDVVVLAGDRGAGDPLAADAGVAGKVLVEIAGRSMLARVLDAVAGLAGVHRVAVVCPDRPEFLAVLGSEHAVDRIDPADGPAASVAAALHSLGPGRPALVVTGDHPLLRTAWLEDFAARARSTGADAVVGVAGFAEVAARFPGNRRTHYRFADGAVCGTNLFYFSGDRGAVAAATWRRFEADRKKPWKILARLGIVNLLRYLSGRMTLDRAADRLSRRLGIRVAAVPVPEPAAAVDVDSAADLALVRTLIAERESAAA